MCDYSLHGIPNRLAVEGEPLVVHQFLTGSKGLASLPDVQAAVGNPAPFAWGQLWSTLKNWFSDPPQKQAIAAVCIPPGARLQLRDIPPRVQTLLGVMASEEVTFVQLSAEAYQYRDAVKFKNGQTVLLQKLDKGQQVDVLCLASTEEITRQMTETPISR